MNREDSDEEGEGDKEDFKKGFIDYIENEAEEYQER